MATRNIVISGTASPTMVPRAQSTRRGTRISLPTPTLSSWREREKER